MKVRVEASLEVLAHTGTLRTSSQFFSPSVSPATIHITQDISTAVVLTIKMALSAVADLTAFFHRFIAPPLCIMSSAIGTLCLLFFFILLGCFYAAIFSGWANMHPSAFIGLLVLVEVPALILLLIYVLDHVPTLQETNSWTDIFIWVYFFIVSLIPGVLLATSISRTQYHDDRILQQRRDQTNRIVAWMKRNNRFPSASEMHDLDTSTSDSFTEVLPTYIERNLQGFHNWWIKFANWACDLTMAFNSDASLRSSKRTAEKNKNTVFPWPAWLILIYIILYCRMLACMWWLKSTAKMILHATRRYAFSWHFVEQLVWAALVTGAVHWLLKQV